MVRLSTIASALLITISIASPVAIEKRQDESSAPAPPPLPQPIPQPPQQPPIPSPIPQPPQQPPQKEPQEPPKKPQEPPKEPPKKPQEPPKEPPKKPQEPPKEPPKKPQEPPKEPPKKPQEPPKEPPKKPQEPPKIPPKQCHPLSCKDGYLGVIAKNGTALGYVSKDFRPIYSTNPTWAPNIYTIGNKKHALVVTLPSTDPKTLSHIFNIATTINEPDHKHPWFGAAQFDDPLGVGKPGYALLTGTKVDKYPQPAHLSTSNGNPGESLIWSYDCKSHSLVPHWVNKNKSSVQAKFFYILKGNPHSNGGDGLGITGDSKALTEGHWLSNIPVDIKFIPTK